MSERISKTLRPDGSLYSHDAGGFYDYVSWRPGQATVTLDGDFTPAELRWIANQIEKPKPEKTK